MSAFDAYQQKYGSGVSGAYSDNYERYVRKLFVPASQVTTRSLSDMPCYAGLDDDSASEPLQQLSPSMVLRMERMEEGDRYDADRPKMYSPLEMMYTHYGKCGLEDCEYKQYPVYETKKSSEYFSVLNRRPRVAETPAIGYKVAKTSTSPNIYSAPPYDSRRYAVATNTRAGVPPSSRSNSLLIDYSQFRSAPLSPHFYFPHERSFTHHGDSRIVGSDFVMLNLRPQDPFLHKIDKTLAAAKKH